jgi:hypothetical protein
MDFCGKNPTLHQFQRLRRRNGLLTDLPRGTLTAVHGIWLSLRPLHTIVALLLAAAALLSMAQLRAVAGPQAQATAHRTAHAQHVAADLAAIGSEPQGALTPCGHVRGDPGAHHKSRPPCCSGPTVFGLLSGTPWGLARVARPLDPIRLVAEPRPASAYPGGIERPPRHG